MLKHYFNYFKSLVRSLRPLLGADRRRGLVRGSPVLIRSLAGTESGYLTDAARRSGLFLFVFLS